MSRIYVPTPRLELEEISYEPSESTSTREDTTSAALRRRMWLLSAPGSHRTCPSSPGFVLGVSVGYRSSSSPFGSSALH